MKIVCFSQILEQAGLQRIQLTCLYPDADLYNILAFQPSGHITWSDTYVKNFDNDLALKQHTAFLSKAAELNSNLALVPEYSCPWSVIENCANGGPFPGEGDIWIIGCESIHYQELEAKQASCADQTTLLYEHIVPQAGKNFVDPVCYLFMAKDRTSGESRKVILVQFKTEEMGDRQHHFERNNLQVGSTIYTLENDDHQTVKLLTMLCSDALSFTTTSHLAPVLQNSLIIHLQLNPEPRNASYTDYRNLLFRNPTATTDLICLNWARYVEETTSDKKNSTWPNISGSGIYQKCNTPKDDDVNKNHKKGLYATFWHPRRSFVHFINYDSGIYHFRCPKVCQVYATGAQGGRTMPEMLENYFWDSEESSWNLRAVCDDAFTIEAAKVPGDLTSLHGLAESPLDLERMVILSVGLATETGWWNLRKLPTFLLKQDEIVNRVSFAQDHSNEATEYRMRMLRKYAVLASILAKPDNYPIQIADLKGSNQLRITGSKYNQNILDSNGECPATVIYIGENPISGETEKVFDDYKGILSTEGGDPKRLVVWYRDLHGNTICYNSNEVSEIDEVDEDHPAMIDKEA